MICTWDPETWEVITKDERERYKDYKTIEQAAWYKDLFKQDEGKNKSNPDYAAPEVLYNLDSERSVKTLHERNKGNYAEGVGSFQVGGEKEEKS